MKKYKLIKEYPGSIKLGDILEVEEVANKLFSVTCLHRGVSTAIPRSYVLEYPEYWQEVIEKDYEILSFKSTNGNCCCGTDIIVLDKNGNYSWNHPSAMNLSTQNLSHYINNSNWSIHSVKRLSDGEVFTIGDKVTHHNMCSPIKRIYLYKCGSVIEKICVELECINSFELQSIQHSKKPLFTTEDGVDIFEGDDYYFTNIVEFNLEKPYSKIRNKKANITDIEAEKNYPNTWKNFSTKKAAEEWIIMNKPCLSIKDIEKAIKDATDNKLERAISPQRYFYNLVKSKLNL